MLLGRHARLGFRGGCKRRTGPGRGENLARRVIPAPALWHFAPAVGNKPEGEGGLSGSRGPRSESWRAHLIGLSKHTISQSRLAASDKPRARTEAKHRP
jgi:hypothetical protein